MELAGKDLGYYLGFAKLPVIIYAVLSIIALLVGIAAVFVPVIGLLTIVVGLGMFLIGAILAAWVGWRITKEGAGEIVHTAVGGAIYGILVWIISVVVGGIQLIVSLIGNVPQATSGMFGAALGGMATGAMIGGFILGTVIFGFFANIIVGSIVAIIGGLIAKYV